MLMRYALKLISPLFSLTTILIVVLEGFFLVPSADSQSSGNNPPGNCVSAFFDTHALRRMFCDVNPSEDINDELEDVRNLGW